MTRTKRNKERNDDFPLQDGMLVDMIAHSNGQTGGKFLGVVTEVMLSSTSENGEDVPRAYHGKVAMADSNSSRSNLLFPFLSRCFPAHRIIRSRDGQLGSSSVFVVAGSVVSAVDDPCSESSVTSTSASGLAQEPVPASVSPQLPVVSSAATTAKRGRDDEDGKVNSKTADSSTKSANGKKRRRETVMLISRF